MSIVVRSVALMFCGAVMWAQSGPIITTYAGSDPTFNAGLPLTATPLGAITALTFDAQGRLYLAVNNRVVRSNAGGKFEIVAGNGIATYSGDGGAAVNASLGNPQGLAVDRSGNLYIADSDNAVIRKVDTNGIITTYAGTGDPNAPPNDGGPAANAGLNLPTGVVFDSQGNLFVSETDGDKVRCISPDGIIQTVAGTGVRGFSGDGGPGTSANLNEPRGLAVDRFGALLIADSSNNVVRQLTGGILKTIAGNTDTTASGDNGPATRAGVPGPSYIATDNAGNLFISDGPDHVIRRVDANGIITTYAGTGNDLFAGDGGPSAKGSIRNPASIAVGPSGNLAVADVDNHRVRQVSAQGVLTTLAGDGTADSLGDNGPATSASIYLPLGLVVDNQRNLYVVDSGDGLIRKVSPDGRITSVAGDGAYEHFSDGLQATSASLGLPTGLATDAQGNLYIADGLLQTVRKVNTAGVITTVAGTFAQLGDSGDGGPATSALLKFPTALAFDAQGNMYISDTLNFIVRKVAPNGTITTVAGNRKQGSGGDRGLATQASFTFPFSLTLDSSGALYIADDDLSDTANGRIRKVDARGIITTIAGAGASGSPADGIPATQARIESPTGLVFDKAGNLYFAEADGARVRKIDTRGIITTIAGQLDDQNFSGDGGPALRARLNNPVALAIDGPGNIYIADSGNNRIRKIIADAITYQAAPQSLSFQVQAGAAVQSQTVSLSSSVSGLGFTASASSQGGNWLSVSPVSGVMPGSVVVTADPQNLKAGSYQGTVTVTVPSATSPVQTLSISLTVLAGNPPKLSLSSGNDPVNPGNFNFTFVQGAASASTQLVISNSGAGALDFNISAVTSQGGNWLSATPAAGTASPQAPAAVTITASPAGLAPGSYRGVLTVKSNATGESRTITVNMSIAAAAQKLLLSQSGITFRAVAGGGAPLSQQFAILNIGKGSMNWTAQASTLAGGNWLSVGSTNGTVVTPFLDAAPVDINVNSTGLSQGTYYGQVQVRATGAENGTQIVCVILDVAAAGTQLPPEIRPSGLVFTGLKGSRPSSQTISIANLQAANTSYASSRLTFDGASWFVHTPTNASITPGIPGQVVVQPGIQDLAAGIYNGVITFQFQDGSVSTVKLLTVVAQPDAVAATGKGGARTAGGCTPKKIKMQLMSSQSPFPATVGLPNTIEVKVVDDCGAPVTAARVGAGVNATFSTGDPGVSMIHTMDGRWSRTWQPRAATTSGPARISMTALILGGDLRPIADQMDVMVNIGTGADIPLVNPGGVVNSASYQGNAPVAPGSIIAIFGSGMADGSSSSSSTPLDMQLGNADVRLGDRTLPLYFATGGQINAQVPFDVPTDTQLQLLVRHGSRQSVPEPVNISTALPAIFSINQSGAGQGVITNGVTNVVADAAHPLKPGDVMTIYCTGLGAVSPVATAGTPAPAKEPLPRTVNPVTVVVGGQNAAVAYAGLAPNFIGLYQVNAVVPAGAGSGQIPVTLSVAGQTSPVVTIALQ